ncbi:hypothetical protein F5Y10DRAFT_232521 [Nemania abortiva]|nr:hypothetical protein F5Y10DRAFT_232521 [Nemania abortiva]
MLRRLRFPKNVLSLGARINSTKPSHHPEVVRIQRVKFQKKRIKASSVVVPLIAAYAFYEIVTYYLVALMEENGLGEMTEEERQELEEEDEGPIFIPFPGFTRTVEPIPFKSTDPEWQAYIRVNKDNALLKQIRLDLAQAACSAVTRHPVLSLRVGKSAAVTKWFLDIQYPLRPPPTFVRKGLSLGGGDGIMWTEQPVDPNAVFWTRQALWPSALTVSLWAFTSALMAQNATTIARFFGYESQGDPLSNMQQAMGRIHQQIIKQPGKPGPVLPSLPSQGRTGEGSATSSLPPVDKRSTGSTATPETLGTKAGVDNAIPAVPSAKDIYMIRTAQEHTSGPWDKFKKTLVKRWRPAPAYPPRGSIRVSGLVEITTERAFLTVDCNGWWDPQTEKFDRRTLSLQLRTIRPKLQSALR